MSVEPRQRKGPQTGRECDRGQGKRARGTQRERLSGRDGSGGALIATSLSPCRSDARTLSQSRIRSKKMGASEREWPRGMRTEC